MVSLCVSNSHRKNDHTRMSNVFGIHVDRASEYSAISIIYCSYNRFLDVFPNEPPGVPPKREIDFAIEMQSRVDLILIPSY